MELVDTHCHIHFDSYPLSIEKVLSSATKAGVTRLICVGTTLEDSRAAVNFAKEYRNAWATAGTHPHDSTVYLSSEQPDEALKELLREPKVVATGEVGLDYYRSYSPAEDQKTVLRRQIEIGQGSAKPFIFHVRDAWKDFWDIYDDYQNLKGVVHSFTAHRQELEQVLERGLYISLNGIMTFTKDEEQLAAARTVPLNRLLLETDAPFLTPVPFRGKTCEPKHVLDTARFLAEFRDESLEELAAASTANAEKLFGLK